MKNRNELPNILNQNNFKVGVEVGSFKGAFSKTILENWNGKIYMVDVWRSLSTDEYDDSSNALYNDTSYSEAMKSIQGFEDRAFMLRMKSSQAIDLFADESLDFIYIDANHAYDFVKEDMRLWYPKLKKGGLFCGHDYLKIDWYNDPNFLENNKDKHIFGSEGNYFGIFGVNPAVDEFCQENGYQSNVTDEWFGTWWFFKK